MSITAVLPRVLGTLFYFSPKSNEAQLMFSQLSLLSESFPWSQKSNISAICEKLVEYDMSDLSYPFSLLFEGQGKMPAPPWGSVYLDEENLLMGKTTLVYRKFLSNHHFKLNSAVNEPEDQFGLMLLAMAAFMETEEDHAVNELMQIHLVPWAYRYLELVQQADESGFYSQLAVLAKYFLEDVQKAYEITVIPKKLYL